MNQLLSVALAACALLGSIHVEASELHARTLYSVTKSIPLGVPDEWDYLAYDSTSHRVYVAHGTSIVAIDGRSGELLGSVPVPGANGVAVVPAIGKGYAGSSRSKSVIVFDLGHLGIRRAIPADEDTDGIVYDPASRRVFVVEQDPQKLLVIDSANDSVVTRIVLHGKPESAVADGNGKLYVNIGDAREIQRIDTRTASAEVTWPIAACESPHGLSIDVELRRLFATCLNSKMVVVDTTDGRIVAVLPIGFGSDAAFFDAARKRVLSSNWDGTLSVISVNESDRYVSLGDIPTQPLARTMALDPESGRIYLVAADRVQVDPRATNPLKRYGVRPGSVRLLFADPTF